MLINILVYANNLICNNCSLKSAKTLSFSLLPPFGFLCSIAYFMEGFDDKEHLSVRVHDRGGVCGR